VVKEAIGKRKNKRCGGLNFSPNTFFLFCKKERTCAKKEKTGKSLINKEVHRGKKSSFGKAFLPKKRFCVICG